MGQPCGCVQEDQEGEVVVGVSIAINKSFKPIIRKNQQPGKMATVKQVSRDDIIMTKSEQERMMKTEQETDFKEQTYRSVKSDISASNVQLRNMIEKEGLEYVDEIKLPQDPQSIYSGYIDPQTNKRRGQGTKIYKNGDKYSGEWDKDKQNGRGKFWHADGDFYDGEWLNGKAHGKGFYKSANGSSYLGAWVNDLQEGSGKETWPDQS